jgi:hypothetical protein
MAEAQLERRLNTKYLLKVFVFRPTLTSLERTNASKRIVSSSLAENEFNEA